MAVKAEGRRRYVAFRVAPAGAVGFDDVVETLRARDDDLWLIGFDGEEGILRCPHTRRDAAVAWLQDLETVGGRDVEVETLGTSGTIRRCRRKFLG